MGADHLSVGGNVPKPFTLSLDEFRKLPHQTIQVMNEHEKKQETYEGVPLADLLKQAGAPQGEQIRGALMTTYVIAEGSDGYRALFSLAELIRASRIPACSSPTAWTGNRWLAISARSASSSRMTSARRAGCACCNPSQWQPSQSSA
jgi:DMSO/TMAO reductase YedYZ molybdopterin-dependent catalytic subunit